MTIEHPRHPNTNGELTKNLSDELESMLNDHPILQDLSMEYQNIVDHILFHKALISDESDGEKYNEYIELVNRLKYGTHVAINDPYDKAIAITFQLAMDENLDPWDIDLVKFSDKYLDRIKEHDDVDLVTAGRIIYMAWFILKKQSDIVLVNAENLEVEEPDYWQPSGEWLTDDMDFNYTNAIINSPKAPLQEMVWRKGERPVTLLELVGAFEEAKKEAEVLKILNEQRKLQRDQDKRLYRARVNQNMHKEDLEADITMIYERICQYNGRPIQLSDIHNGEPEDKITSLVSSLYLANRRKINIWQKEFPYGTIYIENLRDKKKGRAPPLPGVPAEDMYFRGLRVKDAEDVVEGQIQRGKENKDKKDRGKKKEPAVEIVTSKKGIAS
jgi:segregation and condensation protein A